ncbi:MAG TPA: c-type cytochrome [Verrucomicrobiae bacterium]|nr:c-type cytochrome [Verrucomicrobiae bacterium]
MKTFCRAVFVSFLTIAAASIPATSQVKESNVARGKYIVENVVMCEQCHTPRDEQGNPDRGRWLMGGPLQIRATYPNSWATVTPRLAGQPPGTDAEVVKLLTTGIWKTGAPPNPPMPPFRMTQADAEAVVAYLKSLGR